MYKNLLQYLQSAFYGKKSRGYRREEDKKREQERRIELEKRREQERRRESLKAAMSNAAAACSSSGSSRRGVATGASRVVRQYKSLITAKEIEDIERTWKILEESEDIGLLNAGILLFKK